MALSRFRMAKKFLQQEQVGAIPSPATEPLRRNVEKINEPMASQSDPKTSNSPASETNNNSPLNDRDVRRLRREFLRVSKTNLRILHSTDDAWGVSHTPTRHRNRFCKLQKKFSAKKPLTKLNNLRLTSPHISSSMNTEIKKQHDVEITPPGTRKVVVDSNCRIIDQSMCGSFVATLSRNRDDDEKDDDDFGSEEEGIDIDGKDEESEEESQTEVEDLAELLLNGDLEAAEKVLDMMDVNQRHNTVQKLTKVLDDAKA